MAGINNQRSGSSQHLGSGVIEMASWQHQRINNRIISGNGSADQSRHQSDQDGKVRGEEEVWWGGNISVVDDGCSV